MILWCLRMILCLWIMCELTKFAGDKNLVLCYFHFSAKILSARIALSNYIGKHVSTCNFCFFHLQKIDCLSFRKNFGIRKTHVLVKCTLSRFWGSTDTAEPNFWFRPLSNLVPPSFLLTETAEPKFGFRPCCRLVPPDFSKIWFLNFLNFSSNP